MVSVETELGFNSLIWISSLPPAEQWDAAHHVAEVEYVVRRKKVIWIQKNVSSSCDFELVISEIVQDIRERGLKPIIHLDMHGSEHNGLAFEPSGEFYPWQKAFRQFQSVNKELNNNLLVVSAVCFGMKLITPIELQTPTPFHVLLAPNEKVTLHELFRNVPDFYSAIFSGESIDQARNVLPSMDYFHCEKLLAVTLARVVKHTRSEPDRAKRIQRLISEARATYPNSQMSDQELNEYFEREIALSLGPHFIERHAKTFLMGSTPQFTWEDLERLSKQT